VAASLPFKHIAIEGPIGVGKRSLTNLLAKRFRGTRVLEDVESPFIEDFDTDKRGAAVRTELFVLLSRYDQQRSLSQRDLFTELVVANYPFAKSKIFAYLTLDASELLSDGSVQAVGTAVSSLTSSPGEHAATASTPATRRRCPLVRCIGAL